MVGHSNFKKIIRQQWLLIRRDIMSKDYKNKKTERQQRANFMLFTVALRIVIV